MILVIDGADHARRLVDSELGVTEWIDVTQEGIDRFAAATGDDQWIHVDVERAAGSDFGTTIAHGLYTLSLGPSLARTLFAMTGFGFGLNYGYERVRFPAPLPSGSRLRMRATLLQVADVPGGIQLTVRQRFERDGAEKPVCVADSVSRWLH